MIAVRPRILEVVAALLVLVVYACVLWQQPAGVFQSPDEGGKFLIMRSLSWEGGSLHRHLAYGAERLDPHLRFYPRSDGARTFPYPVRSNGGTLAYHWPVLFPAISKPFYDLAGSAGLRFAPMLGGWLIAVLSGYLAAQSSRSLAPATMVVVGLTTPVFFYSVSFWEHTLASLLGVLAVIFWMKRRTPLGYALACGCILSAILLRIELIVLGLALVLAALITRRLLPADATAPRRAGHRVVVLAMLVLSAVGLGLIVDHFLPSRLHAAFGRFAETFASLPEKLAFWCPGLAAILVNSSASEGPTFPRFWVNLALAGILFGLFAPFIGRRWRFAGVFIGLAAAAAFSWLLLAPDRGYRALHGLFPIAPVLMLAPHALVDSWRRRDATMLRLGVVTAIYVVLGVGAMFMALVDHDGMLKSGLEWGPRYLFTLYPLLGTLAVISAAAHIDYVSSRAAKVGLSLVFLGVIWLGSRMEIRGIDLLQSNLRLFSRWEEALRLDGPIVTDLWWLPASLAELFATREMVFVSSSKQAQAWATIAADHGVRRFVWASMAAGVDGVPDELPPYRLDRVQQLDGLMIRTFRLEWSEASAGPAS